MNRTATLILLGIFSLTLSASTFGQLGTGVPQEDKKVEIELAATRLGQQFDFSGLALKEVANQVETFGVRAVADLPDGTFLEVLITTDRGEHSVGTIKMFLGSGMLELVSSQDPSPAFPVSGIREVLVTFRGQTVLSGRFPS